MHIFFQTEVDLGREVLSCTCKKPHLIIYYNGIRYIFILFIIIAPFLNQEESEKEISRVHSVNLQKVCIKLLIHLSGTLNDYLSAAPVDFSNHKKRPVVRS